MGKRSPPATFPPLTPLHSPVDSPHFYGLSRVKSTFPVEAPPTQVPLILPVGHTARAARIQPSHLPLEILMVAPLDAALSVKSAVPDSPVVLSGAPPHFVMVPAMPPQMPSSATFWSWKTMSLLQGVSPRWEKRCIEESRQQYSHVWVCTLDVCDGIGIDGRRGAHCQDLKVLRRQVERRGGYRADARQDEDRLKKSC